MAESGLLASALLLSRPEPPRRQMVLHLDTAELLAFLRMLDGTTVMRCKGLPEDARVVGIKVDEAFNRVSLLLESESFNPVEPQYTAPSLNLTLSTFTPRPDHLLEWWR